jgi:RNA polymerase sigma-70 factor, ECF subfamily
MQSGDSLARERLMELIHGELHRIARYHLRSERPSHTLQPTALISEAYIRLFGHNQPKFSDRVHFLRMMSLAMRRILVDYARSRNARGGDHQRLTINSNPRQDGGDLDAIELLGLHSALEALARQKKASAQYVEMHYFGGMTAEEIAEVTGRSVHVVRQGLRFAQAWLRRYME